MKIKKGEVRNPGGRTVGSKNKVNRKARNIILKLVEEGEEKLRSEMELLEGKDYVDIYLKMMEYVLPKLSRIEYDPQKEQEEKEVEQIKEEVLMLHQLPLTEMEKIKSIIENANKHIEQEDPRLAR